MILMAGLGRKLPLAVRRFDRRGSAKRVSSCISHVARTCGKSVGSGGKLRENLKLPGIALALFQANALIVRNGAKSPLITWWRGLLPNPGVETLRRMVFVTPLAPSSGATSAAPVAVQVKRNRLAAHASANRCSPR